MLFLIAKREFRTRAMSKANIIMSIVIVVVIVGAALIIKPFISDDDSEPATVNVAATTAELIPYLEQAASAQEANLAFVEVDATDPTDVPDGVLGVVVGEPLAPEVLLEDGNDQLVTVVASASAAATLNAEVSELGGDPATVASALEASTPTVTMVGEQPETSSGAYFAGLIVVALLFTLLIQSASVIMMSVVEEKSSRVVEILLSTVRPGTLLGGKVLGVGLYALVQAVTSIVPLLFAAWYLDLFGELEVSVSALLLNFGVWFVLGFTIFTVFFGGLAAIVSRQEDLGAVTTPMMLLMFVPLYLAIYLVPSNPDGTITKVLTQVPFFAPFMVPMRMASDTISTGEIVLALALCLISIPILTWIAGRVYAGAVLNTGGRMKISAAFRSA